MNINKSSVVILAAVIAAGFSMSGFANTQSSAQNYSGVQLAMTDAEYEAILNSGDTGTDTSASSSGGMEDVTPAAPAEKKGFMKNFDHKEAMKSAKKGIQDSVLTVPDKAMDGVKKGIMDLITPKSED